MDSRPHEPADTRSMGIVHSALRRDLRRAHIMLETAPYPAGKRSRTLGDHILWMTEFLHMHHTGEDEGLWPLIRSRNPSAGALLDRMDADHKTDRHGRRRGAGSRACTGTAQRPSCRRSPYRRQSTVRDGHDRPPRARRSDHHCIAGGGVAHHHDVTRVREYSHECRGAHWKGSARTASPGVRFRGTIGRGHSSGAVRACSPSWTNRARWPGRPSGPVGERRQHRVAHDLEPTETGTRNRAELQRGGTSPPAPSRCTGCSSRHTATVAAHSGTTCSAWRRWRRGRGRRTRPERRTNRSFRRCREQGRRACSRIGFVKTELRQTLDASVAILRISC